MKQKLTTNKQNQTNKKF